MPLVQNSLTHPHTPQTHTHPHPNTSIPTTSPSDLHTNLINTSTNTPHDSSVASLICLEGQSERNFPIFAFSSRFFLFFPDFSPIFPDFSPIFGKFSLSGVALCPPCHPSGYATAPRSTPLCPHPHAQDSYSENKRYFCFILFCFVFVTLTQSNSLCPCM